MVHVDDSPVDAIQRFFEELGKYSRDTVWTIAMGDVYVYKIKWLKHASTNSKEGTELEAVCCSHGLTQHVKFPTRSAHFLDLVMSNCSSGIRCEVVPGIHDNDHDGVLAIVNVGIPATTPVRRLANNYTHAGGIRFKIECAAA